MACVLACPDMKTLCTEDGLQRKRQGWERGGREGTQPQSPGLLSASGLRGASCAHTLVLAFIFSGKVLGTVDSP